ncbi:MAG TPA: hypothetical protein DCM08_08690 [Microscillaceae bacterium]|nr:hypothetical protein [Microscillaceae bacterium]
MLNIYEYFKKMQDEQTILYFKGEITDSLLTSILQLIDDKLEKRIEDTKVKKKVFSILLECLQNIYNYYQHQDTEEFKYNSAVLMIKKSEEAYYVITGNYLRTSKIIPLRAKLEKVNQLNKDELKDFYKETLDKQDPVPITGGAGLGIIDIARKSGERIDYSFDTVNSDYSFYSLQVKVTV